MTADRTYVAAFEIRETYIVRPLFDTGGHDVRAFMIGAVNPHAGDTERSHLANRYFLGALHRGWPLDETEAARRAMEVRVGLAELPTGFAGL